MDGRGAQRTITRLAGFKMRAAIYRRHDDAGIGVIEVEETPLRRKRLMWWRAPETAQHRAES